MKWWQNPKLLAVLGTVLAVLVAVGLAHRDGLAESGPATAEGAPVGAVAAASPQASPNTSAAPTASTPASPASPRATKLASVPRNVLPDLVGADLQEAWDGARRAGYRFVTSHDASGRGRRQFIFSSWKVCDQSPDPGPLDRELRVELGVVRHDEKCPTGAAPTSEPKVVDGRMPNLVGRSVIVVRRGLRGDAHIDVDDLGGGRPVLIETHWVVCTQRPAEGQPVPDTVGVGVVKYGEHCPG
ncbi:hypothetical protein [Embleya hyalina]|uniref:PASTA domain-containing protein n=1 Tax=Embleya hyalina TaxID=516124 RepID=A0A401Z0H9_9ACTN|nr:hypothetical protein [Embleya hyalina]GCE00344.1 hypothetical protein EHYA_08069 [Embleya hyalina]